MSPTANRCPSHGLSLQENPTLKVRNSSPDNVSRAEKTLSGAKAQFLRLYSQVVYSLSPARLIVRPSAYGSRTRSHS